MVRRDGYYALVAGELTHRRATPQVSRGMSKRFPIPVALLARLAVDRRHHGSGIGSSLLLDALDRVRLASEHGATRAVVDAISDTAASSATRSRAIRSKGSLDFGASVGLGAGAYDADLAHRTTPMRDLIVM